MAEIAKQKQSGRETLRYSLVPKAVNRTKMRFIIAGAEMKVSGFHLLISLKDANEILEYLEAGDIAALPPSALQNEAWDLAQAILSFSRENLEVKDQRKRQVLERSAKGLVRELAFVFKMTLKETAARIRKSLGDAPKINPSVLVALVHASED